MAQNEAAHSSFPTDGIDEWLQLVEHALHGVYHALSNRVVALSALVELHQLGDLVNDPTAFDTLGREVVRLDECNRVLRLLPRDTGVGDEALILADVFADVLSIHRFLHDWRDVPATVVPTRYVEPVRLERWALLRVLTLLLADAKRFALAHRGTVQIVSSSDELWARVELRTLGTAEDAIATSAGPYADALAEAIGGRVNRRAGAIELQLPTLKARRAADRR